MTTTYTTTTQIGLGPFAEGELANWVAHKRRVDEERRDGDEDQVGNEEVGSGGGGNRREKAEVGVAGWPRGVDPYSIAVSVICFVYWRLCIR